MLLHGEDKATKCGIPTSQWVETGSSHWLRDWLYTFLKSTIIMYPLGKTDLAEPLDFSSSL